jgi:hypothetical protein
MADRDFDGDVDGSDLTIIATDLANPDCANTFCLGDLNYDGKVDSDDVNIFAGEFGSIQCNEEEPALE